MGTPTPGGEGTPSKSCPPSSPLSSPGEVELSDSPFLDQVLQLEAQASARKHPQPEQTDQVQVDESESGEPADGPRSGSYKALHDEDELTGDPDTMSTAKETGDLVGDGEHANDSAATLEPSSISRPTRRMPDRQKKIVIKQVPKPKPRRTVWTTERLLTDPKSPLAKADLRSIVANPMAWDVLDIETRAEILALFPHKHMILDAGTENARPDIAAMMNDDTFRGDCASYTENISQGRHDQDWLADAYNAHHRRKLGDFDEFMVQKIYDDWGVELPDNFKPRRMPQRCEEMDRELKHDEKHDNEVMAHGKKQLESENPDVVMQDGLPTEQ